METWKPLPLTTDYEVSDLGNIRRTTKPRRGPKIGEHVKKYRRRTGYEAVHLWINGKNTTHQVHRLVMLAFNGDSDLQVDHKNGDKSDNRLVNLQYTTPAQNKWKGWRTIDNFAKGERHGNSKLSPDKVEAIHVLRAAKWSAQKIANVVGCSSANVFYILKGTAWAHQHPGRQLTP